MKLGLKRMLGRGLSPAEVEPMVARAIQESVRERRVLAARPPGLHGVNVLSEEPVGEAPEPVSLPILPKGGREVNVAVRVHENAEGVRFVAVETVMVLMRAMAEPTGPGGKILCDAYELALRDAVDRAVVHGRQTR